ncbi:GumC family protein [Vibrio quintilis]|uniref:Putative tyrosine-protein kinase in cps region n=1 Tax=Vibrio quintilis TaxID=1117707 RepID=A0A1M7YR11_9VIBR|nr:GNVR domain-containing protein [Vibrio quintilis]SHO55064.1 Putative tyrosine-protein kinase in cps region [Vibrio quintilis]
MNELKFRFAVLLGAAWRRRYVIALPVLLLPFAGALISSMAPLAYQAHTSMLIQETAKMNPFLEDLAVSTMLNDRMSALSTLLKSRHVLLSVAKERQLINDQMSSKQIDYVIAKLSGSLNVRMLGKDFIKIELKANTPQGMKETLQTVSDRFIEQLLAPERSSIRDSSEFLSIHIEKRRTALDDAENALAEFKNQYAAFSPQMQNQLLNQLASLKQSLSEKEAELAGVKKSLGGLDQQLSKTNPVVGKIEEQIIRIRSQLTLLQARYTDAHSSVQAKKRELSRLESERTKLLSETERLLDSDQLWDMVSHISVSQQGDVKPLLITQLHNLQITRSRYESLQEETKSLQQMISKMETQAYSFGDHAKTLHRLQRDVEIKRDLYDELIQRYEMAQLTGSLGIFEQTKRVKIIDLPYTPSTPSNLPLMIFVIAGGFAGLFIGIGIATLMELFDTSIRRQDELESICQAPVLTILPRIQA